MGMTTVPLGWTTGWPPWTELFGADEACQVIQTSCSGSYPTDGSLIRAHGPGGVEYTVVLGRNPCVHVTPLSVVVSHPMLSDPPSVNRPVWWTATVVEPKEKVSGSSSVWWYE